MNRLCDLGWVFFPTPFSVHHGSSALVSAGHSPRGDSVEGGVQKAGSACPPPSFVCFISFMTPYYVRASLFPYLLSLTVTRLADARDAHAPSSDSGVCNKPCQRLLLITRLITSNNPTTRQGCQYLMSEHQRKAPPPPPAIS